MNKVIRSKVGICSLWRGFCMNISSESKYSESGNYMQTGTFLQNPGVASGEARA